MIDNLTLFKLYQQETTIKNRNLIVSNNYGLIGKFCKNLKDKTAFTQEDLFQVGVIGLTKAVERFDVSKGNQFSTFANHYIRGEITHYLRDNSSFFSGGSSIKRMNRKTCNNEELKEYYNYYYFNSLNIKVRKDNDTELLDTLPSKVESEEIDLDALLSPLNEKERLVINDLFIKRLPISTIAHSLTHSPQYISILRHRALVKLRNHHNPQRS